MKKNNRGFKVSRNPITGEILRGYIFQDVYGERWEIVTDNNEVVDPEEVLRKSEYAHNYFKGEVKTAYISWDKFCYTAYATETGSKAFIARNF